MPQNGNKKIRREIWSNLNNKIAYGQSKYEDKKVGNTANKIYSFSTYEAYKRECEKFAGYCQQRDKSCRTMSDCKQYIGDYLQLNKSPYTIKLQHSALKKFYGDIDELNLVLPERSRANITRSRNPVDNDKHFSETKNKKMVDFCKSTGLRRAELAKIRGSDLVKGDDNNWYLHVTRGTKGGKVRDVTIIGDIRNVVNECRRAGDNKIYPKISKHADIHSYRAEYASNFYNKIARPIESLSPKEVYHCRKDLNGVKYDKKAMLIVSQSLGHNRIDVIAGHYLHK